MVKDRFIKKLWISFGVIVASIIIAVGVMYYFSGSLSKQAEAIVADRTAVQEQTSAVADLANLELGAAQAAQYQAAMTQLLPSQYELVGFAQWFAHEGAAYNVTANASLQGAPIQPQGGTPGTASFTFSVDGPLSAVTAFMNFATTKSSGFLLSFNSFTISTDAAGYNVTGQGTLFFQ